MFQTFPHSTVSKLSTAKPWHWLTPSNRFNKSIIQTGLPRNQLSLFRQILLFGDGSLTRHLQLLTSEKVGVDVIDMSLMERDVDDAVPSFIKLLLKSLVRRQVWLRTTSVKRLAYAVLWWPSRNFDEYLDDRTIPIWASLSSRKLELYRDIVEVHYGKSNYLGKAFGEKNEFWGRYYFFWHQKQPLTLIYEYFQIL